MSAHSRNNSTTFTANGDTIYHPFPNVSLPATTDPPTRDNPPKHPATWLIFGATGHMGQSLVKSALAHGDKVCAVGRSIEDRLSVMQYLFSQPHTNPATSNYHGVLCDVRMVETVRSAFESALKFFSEVDVIANCSGYGVIGSCEDQDESEVRNQFDTNFIGTLNIIQTSLPYFRERESGRYLIFSSISGALGVPGVGPYCATKYAVEGLIESMLYEVDTFNIKVSLVVSGHMRRDDHAPSAIAQLNGVRLPVYGHFKVLKPSEHYAGQDSPASHASRMLQWIGNNQPTSAVKAAEMVWQLGHCAYPPLRLLLGTFAVDSIRDRLKSVTEEIEDWKHLHYPALEGHEGEMGMDKKDDEDGEQDDAAD